MLWQTPKTNWAVGDGVSNSDFNRIEENIGYLKDSPALNAPTVTTQASGDNSTKAASTAFATGQDLGVGQTWQNVTAGRASGQTYTNTTGKPIMIIVSNTGGAQHTMNLRINGEIIAYAGVDSSGSNNGNNLQAVIPAGATYSVAGTISVWFELR